MNILKKTTEKNTAQAMVEFALVLPILMLIILGLIEAGRLLFIYGSVTTAGRQAVRYGSATGDNGTGTPKYLDCDGIRTSAQAMGFILPIETADIDIQYERGGTSIGDCNGAVYNGPTLENGDRIWVTVTGNYAPMIPIGDFAAFSITTASRRTIFVGIKIDATPGEAPPVAEFSFTKTASSTTYSRLGEDITYTFTLINTGDFDLTVSIDDPMLNGTVCSNISLPETATRTCSATYEITEGDISAGSVTNTATATASDGTNTLTRQASEVITFVPVPQLTLTIDAVPAYSTTLGTPIQYIYTLENTGTVDIISPFSVTDDIASSTTCAGATSPLIPGATTTCTGTYQLTQSDLDAGTVINNATVEGIYSETPVISNQASATIVTKPLTLTITTDPESYYDMVADEEIIFHYRLKNEGPSNLSNLRIDDSIFGTITTCDNGVSLSSTTLGPGQDIDCQMIYTILQDDMDIGYMDRDATGYADNGAIISSLEEIRVLASTIPDLLLEITTPYDPPHTPASIVPEGTTSFNYTYKITNTGNVTLKNAYAIKASDNSTICSGTFSNLAPGASIEACTSEYTIVSPDDWNAGSITNTATANTTYTAWNSTYIPATSAPATSTVYTYDGDRLKLTIIASTGNSSVFAGESLTFYYIVDNTGSTVLQPKYTLTSNLANDTIACPEVNGNINPGQQIMVCSGPYIVSQIDSNNGIFTNEAIAIAQNPNSNPSEIRDEASKSITVIPSQTCVSNEWSYDVEYKSPQRVYYCEGLSCAEWEAQNEDFESGHFPGSQDIPPYWERIESCAKPVTCEYTVSSAIQDGANGEQWYFNITNPGSSQTIDEFTLNSWENSNLYEVKFGGLQIWTGTKSPTQAPIDLLSPPMSLGAGQTTAVWFKFKENPGKMNVTMILENSCILEMKK